MVVEMLVVVVVEYLALTDAADGDRGKWHRSAGDGEPEVLVQFRPLLLGTLLGSSLRAQTPTHIVSGVVFDSVARAPLGGAVVQVALVDGTRHTTLDESAPRIFTGTADASGRYRILGLPAGRFAIGFQHEALNALGIESPLRAFELGDDSSATVDLAIPDGAAVRAQLCSSETRLAGEGLLTGYVLDARSQEMLTGAVVRARWLEFALERKNYRAVTRTVTAIVGTDGRYLACGLTSDEAVVVEVTMPRYRGITKSFSVPSGGAARQDFRLADSGVVSGTTSIAGRVVLPDGSAPLTGYVVVNALALEAPIRNGVFSIVGLPPGSWAVEARVIGYEPQSVLIDAREQGIASTTITLGTRAQVLSAITVLGKRGGDAKILSAIASRRSTSNGTVFLPGNPYLESSYDPADVVRGAPGFRYVSAEVLLSSGCGFQYPPPDEPVMPTRPIRTRTRTLAVYLDGARVGGGLPALRTSVTMREILAMEAYQDIATAPLEWRTNDACSVLAIWTKR
jgi:hypothetical protein